MNTRPSKQPQQRDDWWPVETPIGRITLSGDHEALHFLHLPDAAQDDSFPQNRHRGGKPSSVAKAEEQLAAYFAGELTKFDLALEPLGTPWQVRVWSALAQIPFGENAELRRYCPSGGQPESEPGRGHGEQPEPDSSYHPVPSGNRSRREPHGLWRWPRAKRALAGSRTPGALLAARLKFGRSPATGNPCS